MKTRYFIEEKYYSKSDLETELNPKEINSLLLKKVLERNDREFYKFIFVGVISLRTIIVAIIPKVYFDEAYPEIRIDETVKCLKHYAGSNNKKFDGIDYYNFETDQPNCSELAISEFLLNDFELNGIYRVEKELIEVNGNGDVNWPVTVFAIDPIFNRGQPIYGDTYNHILEDNRQHLLVAIHQWSIGYSVSRYSILLGKELKIDHFDFENDITMIGDPNYLIKFLRSQLHITFSDRGVRLIKSIIFLLENCAGPEEDALSLFGTKKFENVWEAICKCVVNDNYEQIKLKYDIFPDPIWVVLGKKMNSSSTLIPDITTEDPSNGNFYLYDAKYYNLQFTDHLSGEPGYKDILKQFQYQEHIEQKIKRKISNAFLMPLSESTYVNLLKNGAVVSSNNQMAVIGHVEYKLYLTKKIWVIMCPFKRWQELFLKQKTLNYPDMYWQP